jgi:small subunit ribosomal protein S15
MSIAAETKQKVISEHARHDKDSGSAEVQIGVLTARIRELSEHLKVHRKDFHSRRGLILMVGRRNKLLRYIARTNRASYLETIQKLGLRK